MALEDNLVFYHSFDAEDADHPTSGFNAETYPGTLTAPTFNGACVTDGTEAVAYSYTTGNILDIPSNGAFGLAFRVNVDTGQGLANENLFEFGDGFNSLGAYLRASNQLVVWQFAQTSGQVRLDAGSITLGTTATFVFTRPASSAVWTVYKDGSEITFSHANGIGSAALTGGTLTVGAEHGGATGTACAQSMEWMSLWERELTASEMANNMNETDIETALGLGGGGGPGPFPTSILAKHRSPLLRF